MYLESKGVLSLPSDDLRNEILKSFVEFVDPFMPVLDLQQFFQTISEGDESHGRISLLLFYAVMFSGSTFADLTAIQRAGYATRRDARKSLYQKAKVGTIFLLWFLGAIADIIRSCTILTTTVIGSRLCNLCFS